MGAAIPALFPEIWCLASLTLEFAKSQTQNKHADQKIRCHTLRTDSGSVSGRLLKQQGHVSQVNGIFIGRG